MPKLPKRQRMLKSPPRLRLLLVLPEVSSTCVNQGTLRNLPQPQFDASRKPVRVVLIASALGCVSERVSAGGDAVPPRLQ